MIWLVFLLGNGICKVRVRYAEDLTFIMMYVFVWKLEVFCLEIETAGSVS